MFSPIAIHTSQTSEVSSSGHCRLTPNVLQNSNIQGDSLAIAHITET